MSLVWNGSVKRDAEESDDAPAAKRVALESSFMLNSMFGFGGFGGGMGSIRSGRAVKGNITKEMNKLEAQEWASNAADRPFRLEDLCDPEKFKDAYTFFEKLSLADTKSECKSHGLPVTGAKYKLFASLVAHVKTTQFGNKRGASGALGVATVESNAGKIRRALVADLRKGLVWDKKMKKTDGTVKKRLKAQYENCGQDVFSTLFPSAKGASCKVTVAMLEVESISKSMRYGGNLTVEGALTAKFQDGTISISGMYTYNAF